MPASDTGTTRSDNAGTTRSDNAGTARSDGVAPSTGELVSRMTQEISTLMRDEIRLAQLEVTAKAKKTGIGLGLFGGAGVFAWFGTGALVAAAILGIATTLDAWLAALIVGAALLLIAGLAGLLGRKEVSQAAPPLPEEAIAETRADVRAIKQAARR
jgi:uncharacterized membrane protein YqjE